MKKIKVFFLLLTFGLTYLSCSSDDDKGNKKSGFTLQGKFYSTPKGYLIKNIDTTYRWEKIYISSTKLNSINNSCTYSDNLKQDLSFFLLDTDIMALPDGIYNYTLDLFEPTYEVSNVRFRYEMEVRGYCLYDYKILDAQILTGNVTISKAGNIFNIEYSFGGDDEIYITGNYEGELEPYEGYFFL